MPLNNDSREALMNEEIKNNNDEGHQNDRYHKLSDINIKHIENQNDI